MLAVCILASLASFTDSTHDDCKPNGTQETISKLVLRCEKMNPSLRITVQHPSLVRLVTLIMLSICLVLPIKIKQRIHNMHSITCKYFLLNMYNLCTFSTDCAHRIQCMLHLHAFA